MRVLLLPLLRESRSFLTCFVRSLVRRDATLDLPLIPTSQKRKCEGIQRSSSSSSNAEGKNAHHPVSAAAAAAVVVVLVVVCARFSSIPEKRGGLTLTASTACLASWDERGKRRRRISPYAPHRSLAPSLFPP